MKIFDCFMYFDEDILLDLRLNVLNDYVDKFIILEASENHQGKKRNLKFDISKYEKFKNKIKYIPLEKINIDETIKGFKKDVLTKIHGGGATDRKRKLLEKQKKGKARAKQFGKVEIPQEAFIGVLKITKDK